MVTAKVDDRKRVLIPQAKPGQIFSIVDNGNDTITLTVVKAEASEPFPPGSLLDDAEDWNREFGPMAAAMKVPAPPDDWE